MPQQVKVVIKLTVFYLSGHCKSKLTTQAKPIVYSYVKVKYMTKENICLNIKDGRYEIPVSSLKIKFRKKRVLFLVNITCF